MTAATGEHPEGVTVESDPESFGAAVGRADQPEEQGAERAGRVMAETGRDDNGQERQPEESQGPQAPAGSPPFRRPHSLRGGAWHYPFTEPAVRPRTKYRCMARNTMIGTTMVMMPPAVTRFQP